MFKKTWWKGIVSDSGFSVDLKPPHSIEYREGVKCLIVYIDFLVGQPSIDIDTSSIQFWLPPYQEEFISPEKKAHILSNICAALDFSGVTYILR